MPLKVEAIEASPKSLLGKGSFWDEASQNLYFIDINSGTIMRYDYQENEVYTAKIDGESTVGFMIPVANTTDEFAVGLGRRVAIVHWDGKSSKAIVGRTVFEVESDKKDNRFNEAKADPVGRFFGGTMRSELVGSLFEVAAGTFYKYIKGDGVYELLHNIHCSNGMAWNLEEKKFYYIDSCKYDVKEYDYDLSTGEISNERVAIDLVKDGKNPPYLADGMTIDTEGFLYVATFGGSKVVKVDPKKGKIVMEIPIPAKQITSAAFGGPNLDILYVTSGAQVVDTGAEAVETEAIGSEAKGGRSDLAGHVFKITGLGARGLPGVKVRV